jgi:hypothetical protein
MSHSVARRLPDQARGAWVDPRAGEVLLQDCAEQWLAQHTGLRPTTRAKNQHLLGRHILPVLGNVPIGWLQLGAVRAWYAALQSRYPTTADDTYSLLRAICTTAAADERIIRSTCQVRGAGSAASPERPVASIAEVQAATTTTLLKSGRLRSTGGGLQVLASVADYFHWT